MKRNYVRGKIESGIYKDKDFKIIIGKTPADSKIIIGGKEVSGKTLSCHIKMVADKPFNTIWMEFIALDQKDEKKKKIWEVT